MVERASNYHVSFKAIPPSGLLGNMAPFLNTDVTNPRELYSLLDSRHQAALLTASVSVKPQAGARLPPLESSAEVQFRPLGEQVQHSSYPDLVSFRKTHGPTESNPSSVRRSTSLQDVSRLDNLHTVFHTKKLKPILRGHDSKHHDQQHHNEKGGVKFSHKEVRLIKDTPLPPIEGGGSHSHSPVGKGGALALRNGEEMAVALRHSPQPIRRYYNPEHPPEIFPRGQPVKVEKPVTPTYDDYPEAYWELRSPTVQEPSDLKEDMIDRDRYRLQQMSSLHLRAMNKDVLANRLDTYRKWQQQLQQHSPSKLDSARGTANATPATANGVPVLSARTGKQQRMSLPIRNHTLAVAAKSISPSTNPATIKRNKSNNGHHAAGAGGADLDTSGYVNGEVVDVDEARRRERVDAAAKAAGLARGEQEHEVKPLKANVVNLCMEPDGGRHTPTSDVYTGIRKVMFGARPQSDKGRTQLLSQGQTSQSQSLNQGHHTAQLYPHPGSVSLASNNATLGSSQSHDRPQQQRVPSAPPATPPVRSDALVTYGEDASDPDRMNANQHSKHLLLKKFNRLQVFGEKSPDDDNAARDPSSYNPFDVLPTKPVVEKHPYLPQNRPPTYRLDMRNYPARHQTSADRDRVAGEREELAGIVEGYPLLASGRGRSPDKSEATSLSFRFRNGEVIVSRQGKKPSVT